MSGPGAGHILDMINRMKANRDLVLRNNYFKTKNMYLKASNGKPLVYSKGSEKEMAAFRIIYARQKRIQFLKKIVSFILAIAITLVIASSIIWYLKKIDDRSAQHNKILNL